MIREYILEDLPVINEIGKLVKEDFVNKNNIKDINKNVENIYVYEQNNEVIGFVHIQKSFEVIDILNIAIKEDKQKQGIATNLINFVKNIDGTEKIMLEVKANNTKAINFYNKCGFNVINTRKNYYESSIDALIMEMII